MNAANHTNNLSRSERGAYYVGVDFGVRALTAVMYVRVSGGHAVVLGCDTDTGTDTPFPTHAAAALDDFTTKERL